MLVHQHCCLPRYFIGLCTFAMILCTVSPEPACSLKITSDNIYYYQARGRSVSLNCEFTLDSDDLDSLDIEWNIVLPDKQETEKLLLWYSQSLIHNNLYGPLKNRLFFTSPEPQDGDASLTITDLKLTDSGTYQCKVRYLYREQFKRIFLVVMESPDKPVCYMDDEPVSGTNIRLRCTSSQGTPPLKYTWAKLSGNRMLPPDAFVDAHGGDLYLDKITERDSGAYRCTVQNLVGMEECELILEITSPSTVIGRHGPTAGTAAEITAGVGPDKPVCYMDDEPVLGTNIRLRCTSSQGTPPLKYTWAKLSGNQMLPPDAFVDAQGGGLYLDKITERDSGAYRCTVQNLVDMEECELILEITSPSTVIGRHGPTASTAAGITAGAIVALIVLITVTLTPVIYYRRRKRHERAKIPPCQCHQTKSSICGSRRTEQSMTDNSFMLPSSVQLWCEEEDHLYEIMETTSTVRSSSAEDNVKNASIEEGLTACVEAKIEKSEDMGSKGTREEGADEGQVRSSSAEDNVKNASIEEGLTACVEAKIEKSEDMGSKGTREEADDEGQVRSSSAEDNVKNASIEEGLTACVETKIEKSEHKGSKGTREETADEGQQPCSQYTEKKKNESPRTAL